MEQEQAQNAVLTSALRREISTMFCLIEQNTGVLENDIPLDEEEVFSLLTSPAALGVNETEIDCCTGTLGIPELNSAFMRDVLMLTRPNCLQELVQVLGLAHSSGGWLGNARDLLCSGGHTLSKLITTRESLQAFLLGKEIALQTALEITDGVCTGRVASDGFSAKEQAVLRDCNVPQWYRESCCKISYLPSGTRETERAVTALRLLWVKLHYPAQFYTVCFTVRYPLEANAIPGSPEVARQQLQAARNRLQGNHTIKNENTVLALQLANEMRARNL